MKKTNGGGWAGFFKSMWHILVAYSIGTKWQTKETFTRRRKLDLTSVGYRKGDVVVITGGARGIGLETIRILLEADMHVIMGVRKIVEGERAIKRIRADGILSGTVDILTLDLMSLASVKNFATEVIEKYLPITILINNSGVMFPPYAVSEDGYESQFQINYLGHFLLTYLLLPSLIQTGTPTKFARVVNVSSCAHYGGKINFDDLQMEKFYSSKMAYMASKMMQIISTVDLNDKLEKAKLLVRVYSLHPGVVQTDLYKYMWISKLSFITRFFFLTPKQGAYTVAYVALSPEVEDAGGQYFANCKKITPNAIVYDEGLQKKLFDVSCQLAGITDFTIQPTATSTTKADTIELRSIVQNNFIVEVN